MKRDRTMAQVELLLQGELGRERTKQVMAAAQREFERLCAENSQESKAIRAHTRGNIYPAIGCYRAMQEAGLSQKQAFELLDRAVSAAAEPGAAQMRAILKIPGLYRLMPLMWKIVTRTTYGEKAGFRFHFYQTDGKRVKFDMQECLYCKICEKNHCREIVPVFCHTDDVNNAHAHPKLLWNRTKTMGDGADCCDFDVIVKN